MDGAAAINEILRVEAPALWSVLSDLGRRAAFPPDIPQQAAEARGKEFNATIGQITDGAGRPLAPAALEGALAALGTSDRARALLYSPVEGVAELRELWSARLASTGDSRFTLPMVTVGLTHGLSLIADLFAGPDRAVAVATPFWGNYRQTFALRRTARMVSAPAYRGGAFNPEAIAEALAGEPAGTPALAIVNVPSNPGGYSPTVAERQRLIAGLEAAAERAPLLVICDDAYAGLVYEEGVPSRSLFWDLSGRHPNLVPIKVDGATKELSFFGGRVGFLTFPFPPDGEVAQALESKVKCLLRAELGSPVAASQVAVIRALRDGGVEEQVRAIRDVLAERYRVLRRALAAVDRRLLRPLPFNSGCFALVELTEETGLEAEVVRRELLESYATGLISIAPRYLRIAFCSVAAEALPELVRRLEAAVRSLSGQPAG